MSHFLGDLSPQVQAEIIKGFISCLNTIVDVAGASALILLIRFRLRTTKKSQTIEKSTVIEFEGGFKKK